MLKILTIVLGLVVVVAALQLYTSIHPPKYVEGTTPKQNGLQFEELTFTTTDNLKIHAWLIPGKSPKGTIIVGHGYPFEKSNILSTVSFLHPEYNLLLYDHRYFGESEGKLTTAGFKEVKDVEAAVTIIKKKFPGKPVALYGFSMSAAVMLMADVKVDAIIADSPYADLEKMIGILYSMYGPLKWPFVKVTNALSLLFFHVHPKNVSPALAVKGKKLPILLMHGAQDSQIPVEHSRIIKKQNANIELWIVEGAEHIQAATKNKEEYQKKVKDFLTASLQP